MPRPTYGQPDSQKLLYTGNHQEIEAEEDPETHCAGPTRGIYATCTPLVYQNERTSLQQQTLGKIGSKYLMPWVPQAELR